MIKKGITLIGMPGSGKSTIGKLLAEELGLKFLDLDLYMEEVAGRVPHKILEEEGEEKVLFFEETLTLGLNLKKLVFSPGGSIVYCKKAMKKVKRETTVFFLQVPYEIIKKRIHNLHARAIVGLKKVGLKQLFAVRTPLYEKYADIIIPINDESEARVKEKILRAISSRKR